MSSTAGTSTQDVLTSLVSNGVIFGAFMLGFILLRTRFNRIYSPKSSTFSRKLINPEKSPEPLPNGLWHWLLPLLKKSDNFIIQQAGLDGYFFLRYLLIISMFFFASALYVLPILLPVNAANGRHQKGLDILAYQDVKNAGRYYAHVFISWIFFWSFLYVIYRELFFYVSMRENVLSSNRYAKKLSSKTVLFQCVPDHYLSETQFAKLFEGVKKVWVAKPGKDLEKLIQERDVLANKLEDTLNGYIKNAVKLVGKSEKKNKSSSSDEENITHTMSNTTIYDISEYIPEDKRPKHRLGWKGLWGKKVDTLEYCKEQLPIMNAEIEELQTDHNAISDPLNSVFVEFESQYHAQIACQVLPHHQTLCLTPAYVGIQPSDVIWFNLRLPAYEQIVRRFIAIGAITVLVVLWSVPVAFVGMISNITYLTNKLHWLKFIYGLPDVLLGLLTNMAPTIALAVLMSLLPKFIRAMAVMQGCPSVQLVEYFTQQAYFAFQVIQVFLVTTLTSAATSTVTQIIENPTSAMTLLAGNLPKSSNFYIGYIMLQGMSISSGALFQIVPLILHYIMGFLFDKTPRKKWARFTNLGTMSWGTTFPVYTNLAVIAFSYALISPIIILFAACGFFLLYIAYLYNLTYVMKEAPDARGMHYPRALFQSIVGVYIGQICLLGLFVVGKGWGPIVLEVIGLGGTVLVHVTLNHMFDNLVKWVPIDTMKARDGKSDTPSYKNLLSAEFKDRSRVANITEWDGEVISELPQYPIRKYENEEDKKSMIKDTNLSIYSTHTIEYEPEYRPDVTITREDTMQNLSAGNNVLSIPLLAEDEQLKASPIAPFWKRFLFPHIFYSYKGLKTRMPIIYNLEDPDEDNSEEAEVHAYDYPAVSAKCPYLWIPEDQYGFSKTLISEFDGVIAISDKAAEIDNKCKVTFKGNPPSYDEPSDDIFSDSQEILEDQDFSMIRTNSRGGIDGNSTIVYYEDYNSKEK